MINRKILKVCIIVIVLAYCAGCATHRPEEPQARAPKVDVVDSPSSPRKNNDGNPAPAAVSRSGTAVNTAATSAVTTGNSLLEDFGDWIESFFVSQRKAAMKEHQKATF